MILSRPVVRHFTIVSVAALFLTMVFWFGLWALGAVQYREYIDNWVAAHRTLGYQVTYGSRETVGFPNHITLHYSDFVLQNPDGIRIHANDVSLSAFPWQWNRFDAKLKHGFELLIPFSDAKTLSISTDAEVRNHTELDVNGDWLFVDLQMQNANALWKTTPFFSAGHFDLALQRPARAPKDRHEIGLTFAAKLGDLKVPDEYAGPFGAQVASIDVALRVMGPVPDPRRRESVAAWNTGFGTIEFDKFALQWGPLVFLSKGTLALDDDLQPEGAFSAQIGNYENVFKILMDNGYIPVRETGMLDSALNLFAKKIKIAGQPGIEAPVAVQLGGLFLGPVRIFEFPEIEWETPAAALPAPTSPVP